MLCCAYTNFGQEQHLVSTLARSSVSDCLMPVAVSARAVMRAVAGGADVNAPIRTPHAEELLLEYNLRAGASLSTGRFVRQSAISIIFLACKVTTMQSLCLPLPNHYCSWNAVESCSVWAEAVATTVDYYT